MRGTCKVDQLAEAFNAMTARLGDSFQRISDFTPYASRELKTPLTVMRAEMEVALSAPSALLKAAKFFRARFPSK